MLNLVREIDCGLFFQQSNKHNLRGWVTIQSFPENPLLCPVLAITAYISRTKPLCSDFNNFFISFVEPHKFVKACTLAHWMKQILLVAGVDISMFTSHAVRSVSAAFMRDQLNYSVKEICAVANWSTKRGVFQKFYDIYVVK